MTILHRFCTIIPLFLLALALAGCSGTGENPWGTPQKVPGKSAADINSPSTATPTILQAQHNPASTKVAILLPLSGPNAAVGQSMLQAAQLALFDIGDERFELMPQDTQGTVQGASQAATAALSGGAQLILGPLLSEEVKAVRPIAATRNVSVLAFSTDWTLAGGNTYILGFTPFAQVERIAAYAASKGLHSAALAGGTDQYGAAASRAFEDAAQKNGLNLSRTLANPSSYDCVFIPASGSDLTSILPRIANTGARKLGTGLWDDPRVAAIAAMNGAWFAAPSPSARAGFEKRYTDTYGTKPVRIASMAYDATALAATLARMGLAAGTGPAFNAASFKNPNGFAGVDGILRFNASGVAERGMAILEIRGGRAVEIAPAPTSFGP